MGLGYIYMIISGYQDLESDAISVATAIVALQHVYCVSICYCSGAQSTTRGAHALMISFAMQDLVVPAVA